MFSSCSIEHVHEGVPHVFIFAQIFIGFYMNLVRALFAVRVLHTFVRDAPVLIFSSFTLTDGSFQVILAW